MSEPSLNLRGAVDLSAIASPTPAPAKGGKPGLVVEVTTANFNEVISQSTQYPVLVSLYSARTPGSSTLTDLLVDVVNKADGKLLLARVDVDTNPQIVQAFNAQSIPTTFAVVGGQPIPLFEGVPEAGQVDQVITEVLKVAAQNGVSGTVAGVEESEDEAAEEPLPPLVQEAYDAIERDDLPAAKAAYNKILADDPNDADAQAGLAQVGLMERLESVDPQAALDAAQAAGAKDIAAHIAAADVEAAQGNPTAAFNRLISCIRVVFGEERDQVREHLLQLFLLYPADSAEVLSARRALAAALY